LRRLFAKPAGIQCATLKPARSKAVRFGACLFGKKANKKGPKGPFFRDKLSENPLCGNQRTRD
jgi:hypothetical protein